MPKMVMIQPPRWTSGVLSADEVPQLGNWVTKLLVDLTTSRVQSDHVCRLCDEDACGANRPVEQLVALKGAALIASPEPNVILSPSHRRAAMIALVLAAGCWGLAVVMTKAALAEIPPFTLFALQLGASVAVLWLFVNIRAAPAMRRTVTRGLCAFA